MEPTVTRPALGAAPVEDFHENVIVPVCRRVKSRESKNCAGRWNMTRVIRQSVSYDMHKKVGYTFLENKEGEITYESKALTRLPSRRNSLASPRLVPKGKRTSPLNAFGSIKL